MSGEQQSGEQQSGEQQGQQHAVGSAVPNHGDRLVGMALCDLLGKRPDAFPQYFVGLRLRGAKRQGIGLARHPQFFEVGAKRREIEWRLILDSVSCANALCKPLECPGCGVSDGLRRILAHVSTPRLSGRVGAGSV